MKEKVGIRLPSFYFCYPEQTGLITEVKAEVIETENMIIELIILNKAAKINDLKKAF